MKKLATLTMMLALAACAHMGPSKISADYARERVANAETRIRAGQFIEGLT